MTPAPPRAASADDDVVSAYAPRGAECAFANLRLLARVVGGVYDEHLGAAGLRASQLALMWAIVASEPVEQKVLERITRTDQTTLSRTVEKLRAAGLVIVAPGPDRRVRHIRLSARGRRAFAGAMPHWEAAQQEAAAWFSLAGLTNLGRAARRMSRAREQPGAAHAGEPALPAQPPAASSRRRKQRASPGRRDDATG